MSRSERRRLVTVTDVRVVCIHPPQTLAVFVGEEIAADSLDAASVAAAMSAAPQKG